MGASCSRRTFSGRLLTTVGGVLVLGLTAACGGGGASPTPTIAATSAAVPASPQRPALLSPVASPSPAPTTSAAVAKPTQAEAGQTYTVQAGDTLGTIANHFYGDSSQWRRIYDANKEAIGDNPDALKLDTKLTIPPAAATPTPTH